VIILDTNVVSTLMNQLPEPLVVDWLDRQPSAKIWVTTISIYELRFGIAIMPDGRRRRELAAAFEVVLTEDLENRVLPFDEAAARASAELAARRRLAGNSMEIRDNQIAGIALVHRAVLATRNTKHFRGVGLRLIDPWSQKRSGG